MRPEGAGKLPLESQRNAFLDVDRDGEPEARLREAVVAVVFGGTSNEAEVSRQTGQAVCAALGSSVGSELGPKEVRSVEIQPEGRWRISSKSEGLGCFLSELEGVDICFLALHGGDGENGLIQGLLESADIPFTGSNLHSSSVAMDKWVARLIARDAGLLLADGITVGRADWEQNGEASFSELLFRSEFGVCVKPRRGGSSVGVVHGHDKSDVAAAILAILETGDSALLEQWNQGIEVACGVLGNRATDSRALMPIEIRPHAGRFFDYEEKYSKSGAEEFCPPVSLDSACCQRIQESALAIHRALECDGYSRSDFIIPAAGEASGQPIFLELNSLPGLTPRSLLPLAAAEAGMDFTDLCLGIVRAGLQKAELSS